MFHLLFSVFSRFQQHANFYSSGKLSAPSASFTRPTPVLSNATPGQHHNSLPSSETPHITPLNPTHGFLSPAPPQNTTGIRGMNANNKPSDQTPARLQQTPPSIGMHPTFRSDFNVSLRYFLCLFLFCSFMVSSIHLRIFCFETINSLVHVH